MTWPTRPAASANNFTDHFPGSSLDARWTAVTSGTGSVTVTDSYVDINAPASSAAFIYRNVEIDKTKSQLWLACLSGISFSSNDAVMWLLNGASAPVAATQATIDAKTLVAHAVSSQTSTAILDWYFTPSSTQTFWSGSSWGGYTTSSALLLPIELDDYYILGIEIDGVNQRWRLHGWCQTFPTAGTYTFEMGLRLFAITDWITWANTRASADVWLVIGQPLNDDGGANETRVEWVNYSEAVGNQVIDAFFASKQALADVHRIRHSYSYDGKTFVLENPNQWALDLGAGSPDDTEVQEPSATFDGAATDYMFYTGTSGTTQSICVASAPHSTGPQGQTSKFTRFGSNPILSLGASGDFDDQSMGFASVVYDVTDSDSNKRWKMLYMGQKASDSKQRIGYATAPSPTGTWTKAGVVIDIGAGGSNDVNGACSCTIVNYAGRWEVWYEGHDSSNVCHLLRATGTDMGSLTKDGVDYYTPSIASASQSLTANMTTTPGRTVTVGSTTGFSVDATVILDQDTNNDNYATSRIRKVTDSTHLELYHGLTGFTTTYPAKVRQITTGPNFSPRAVIQVGSEWWFHLLIWEPWFNTAETASYAALLEEEYLFKHSGEAPSGGTPAVDYLSSPGASRNSFQGQRSYENMTLLNLPFTAGVWLWRA